MKLKVRNMDLLNGLNDCQRRLIANLMRYKITKKIFDEDGNECGENCQYVEAHNLEEAQAMILARQDIKVEENN